MKMSSNHCPNCSSKEFVSNLNQYDILEFKNGDFQILKSQSIDEYEIFCRECGQKLENKNGKIITKG